MSKLLRRFIPSLTEHLSDDRLASLFCGELVLAERWIARQHLATCWQCRLRQEELEGTRSDRMFDHCRDVLTINHVPKEPEMEFVRKLKLQIQTATPRKSKVPRRPRISFPELSLMNPALVVCMVLSFATILSFYFWWQQRAPRIGENALLVRAEKWDTASIGAMTQGVVYQAVRITMTKQSKKETIARSIYRDTQGKRQPKRVALNATQEQVKSALTVAGLDWDEPLSASGYQSWHDHQHVREDHIARAGTHLLRLTTTVPEGVVAEQSLTVRDTDFHPVLRTVELRDSGTVEIAEVDFKILPWSAVDVNAFEPLESATTSIAANPARVLSFPRTPEALPDAQLDETELAARLILNQLHADTTEQLAIQRDAHGVAVAGLVETDERKRALQSQLRMVPHLTVSIRSVEEVKSKPNADDDVVSIVTASPANQPSQLQTYLQAHGRSIGEINIIAQRLFSAALTISQESKAMQDLEDRFAPGEERSVIASATLTELIYTHRERLETALRQERRLLLEAQNISAADDRGTSSKASLLMDAAERNLALSKELIQTNSPTTRSATQILAEMSLTMNELTVGMQEANRKSQGDSTLSGKK